jgi:hypothetical protein
VTVTTAFDNSTPATNDAIWVEITATSGTPTELHLTFFFQ